MTTTALLTLLLVAMLIAVGISALLFTTANRLDRLHVRTDAGWVALDAALGRRAAIARAVAATSAVGDGGEALYRAADRAESSPRADREAAENELTRLLSLVDRSSLRPALARELDDAEQRVMIARRVHNDAVRDTIALRRRRKVRYFRLAGTARPPEYFEIAEPDTAWSRSRFEF